ncbi:MAG TPA: hypothetical protein VGM39_17055 [Kofleriaceae bacterium]|jgi:hypothetical protein
MKLLLATSVLLLSACPHPQEAEFATADGPIPVVITNKSKETLCTVTISPSLTKMPNTATLYVAKQDYSPPILPGASVRASVKAGTYQIHGENCGFRIISDKQSDEFDIAGPTSVTFGGEDTSSPPDYQRLAFQMHFVGESDKPDPKNCLPTGTPMSYPADDATCCSGNHYYNGTDSQHPFCG